MVICFPPPEVLKALFPGAMGDPGPRATTPSPIAAATPAAGTPTTGAPPASPPPPSTPAPIAVGAPTPLPVGAGNPITAATPPPALPASVGTADNVRLYRVRDGGEHVMQIAHTVLGDRNRWTEIYRL